jgi:hypothetical protein
MNRLILVTLGAFIATALLFSCQQKKYSNVSAISVIPSSSPLFVRINDLTSLTRSISTNNNWWNLVGNLKDFKPLSNQISAIDSFSNNNPEFRSFMNGKEVVISFLPAQNNSFESIIILAVDDNGDQKKVGNFINLYCKNKHYTSLKRKFEHQNFFEVKSSGNETQFCYTIKHGFLLIGKNHTVVEEVAQQLQTSINNKDPELDPLLKTTNNQAQLNIFINHHFSGDILSLPLSKYMKERVNDQKDFSGWSELDATIKGDKVIVSGFSNGNSRKDYFASVLQNQQPGISKIESVLPANTSYFSSFYISDIKTFFSDLSTLQNQKNNFQQQSDQLKQIKNKTGIDLRQLFIEIFDGEMARSSLSLNSQDQPSSVLFTVKTKSSSYTLDKLLQLIKLYQDTPSNRDKDYIKDYKIDNQTTYKIYKFPFNNFVSLLFGNMFGKVETTWFTLYDNYLIFSDSYNSLGKVILSNMLGETLISDKDYSKFYSGLSSKCNYYLYCNTSTCFKNANLFFNNSIASQILDNEEFKKFSHFSWQISSTGNMVYNNGSLIFEQNLKSKPQTVWQSHLNAPLALKPFIVEDKYDLQNMLIVVFDIKNNLYLLNNVGRILWQINTGSPILGNITMIDLFNNGGHQFVFNTRDKLFVIDNNGNPIKNFPVAFRVAATNGVSVFDYEKTHNYRFFFACEDQNIYALDQDGNSLEGWQTNKTDHIISKPIQHFSVDGKDYIVASDRMKDYIFDRKGNVRLHTDYVYQHSANNTIYLEKRTSQHEPRLVSTDSEGSIHYTYFNGTHETVKFNQLDDSHWFLAANTDEDEDLEYIFIQANQIDVQTNIGRTLFNMKTEDNTLEKPCVYNFSSKEKKIGVSSPASNKIYLFNSNGTPCKGFPLDGCTEFSIVFLNDDHSKFCLLVGSPDGYLYNYLVE